MNRSYKSIWNEALGAWVATSEAVKSHGKRSGSIALLTTVLAFGSSAAIAGDVVQTTGGTLGATATGTSAIALGNGAVAAGTSMTAIGGAAGTGTTGTDIVVIGNNAGQNMSGGYLTVVGNGAGVNLTGQYNSVLGYLSGRDVTGDSNTLLGGYAAGNGTKGSLNTSLGSFTGQGIVGNRNTSVGTRAGQNWAGAAGGSDNTAVGYRTGQNASTGGNAALGVTAGNNVTGTQYQLTTADGSTLTGAYNNAFGAGAGQYVNGMDNTAMGTNAGVGVAGSGNVAIGKGAGSAAITPGATVVCAPLVDGCSQAGTTVGTLAVNNTVAFGTAALANSDTAVAIGANASATGVGNVALGANSVATGATLGTTAFVPTGSLITAIKAPTATSEVSVGAVGAERRITNVAAGGADTDAVNVSQLKALDDRTVKYDGSLGDPKPTVTLAGVTSTDGGLTNGTKVTNLSQGAVSATSTDAINGAQLFSTITSGLNFADAGGHVIHRDLGSTLPVIGATTQVVTGLSAAAPATGTYSATNVQTYADAATGQLQVQLADSPKFGATTINSGGTGIISGVTAGVAATDAVNVSQLTTATTTAANMWITGSPTTYAAPTSVGANSTAVGSGASVNAVNSVAVGTGASATTANSVALGNSSTTGTAVAVAGTTLQGASYTFAGSAPAGVVSVGSAGAERQITNVAAGQITATSTDAVNGSQLYATNTALNNLTTSVAGSTTRYYSVNDGGTQGANYNNDGAAGVNAVASGVGASAGGTAGVAVGLNATASGASAIAIGTSAVASSTGGVALGGGSTADRAGMNGQREAFSNVSVGSTQGAISVGSAGSERQITNVAGGTAATDAVNVRQLQAVQAGAVRYDTNADGTVNYNSVTMGNGASSGPVTISNVAPGVAGTDAVNVNQLTAGIAGANAYTDLRANHLQGQIDGVAKKAYAGAAAAMAMESAPYVPGKLTYAAGLGYYQQQSAVAFSLRRTADNGRWSVTGGISASSGGIGARVGIAGVFN